MSNFVGTFPILETVMGCHGNHAFSYSTNRFIFWTTLFCIKGVLLKKKGTHEKLS